MRILHVVGARPNFAKVAPVHEALARRGVDQTLLHTGQHYDANMSEVFFREFGLPAPDLNLDVGSASHAEQTARIMVGFERVVTAGSYDRVLVYGDVNSTLAAALVAAKLGLPVGHVEAGLRSFDRSMPEEYNRLLTDQIADLLFTPSADGDLNLLREGIAPGRIHRVGNVMIDTLVKFLPLASRLPRDAYPPEYALVTLHRPSNVDDRTALGSILDALRKVSRALPVVFPVHPRTRRRIVELGGGQGGEPGAGLHLCDPLGYLEFLNLEQHARVVITDSGGIQEETTYLGVPCLTLRASTERPVTVDVGTNILLGKDHGRIAAEVDAVLEGRGRRGTIPPLWDGHAAERIAGVLAALGT